MKLKMGKQDLQKIYLVNFETVTKFDKDVKKLSKKYNLIKQDLQDFIFNFDDAHKEAISIKNNLFKVRVSNSNKNKGKSAGYRVYYYLKINVTVYLLTIYDKSQIESINENSLNQYINEIIENSKNSQSLQILVTFYNRIAIKPLKINNFNSPRPNT